MIRHSWLAALVLLAACHEQSQAPTGKEPKVAAPRSVPTEPPSESETGTSRAAADALRHYYALISAGDYDDAWRLRTPGRVDKQRFAANFAAYERYDVVVGTPSAPAEANHFVWVQLPVMITGRFKGGKPFGSSGNVFVRRPSSGGGWLVVADS
jgi:hypothetical protein